MNKIMFTSEKCAEIYEKKLELLKKKGYGTAKRPGLGITIDSWAVFSMDGGNKICTFNDLSQTIIELEMIKQAIEEKTGCIL